MAKTRTKIIPDSQIETIKYFHENFMMNPIYKIAILESSTIKLRTLDLIHYASTFQHINIQTTGIDYILSGDHNFVSNRRSGTKESTFIDPDTFIQLECN